MLMRTAPLAGGQMGARGSAGTISFNPTRGGSGPEDKEEAAGGREGSLSECPEHAQSPTASHSSGDPASWPREPSWLSFCDDQRAKAAGMWSLTS